MRCAQCGVTAPIALRHADHGDLCSLCAARQLDADERSGGLGLSASTFGFSGDDADRWDD